MAKHNKTLTNSVSGYLQEILFVQCLHLLAEKHQDNIGNKSIHPKVVLQFGQTERSAPHGIFLGMR